MRHLVKADNCQISLITQPPLLAIVAVRIYKNSRNKKEPGCFLQDIFLSVKNSHKYLFSFHDPGKEDLVSIFLPRSAGNVKDAAYDDGYFTRFASVS